jgi:hypothetical protein
MPRPTARQNRKGPRSRGHVGEVRACYGANYRTYRARSGTGPNALAAGTLVVEFLEWPKTEMELLFDKNGRIEQIRLSVHES